MNEIIRQLFERKSVRAFTDEEISEEIVQNILMSAIMAPTAGNQQLYSIIHITDEDLKKQLSITCDNQPFIAEGKLVLLFCADCLKWYEAFKYGGCDPRNLGVGDFLLAVNDALIAAQNAVVAAESYGIGSCYIGDIMENAEIHQQMLGMPQYVFPAALLVFGYPTQQQIERKKPERVDMKYIVSENSYHHLSDKELRDMLSYKCGSNTYENWLKAFCTRKYNSDFSREMTRSVKEYIKQYL